MDREGRAFPRRALNRDVTAHHLTEAPAYRETKARAAIFARGSRGSLRKLLEKLAHLFRCHPDAGVGNCQRDPVATILLSLVSGNGDSALLGELVSVAHEVQQCLVQA